LSDTVSELGREILNQQEAVNVVPVSLRLPLTWMLALFVKVAPLEADARHQRAAMNKETARTEP